MIKDGKSGILKKPLALTALALTVALGLFSRLHPIGWYAFDKSLGDVLYAVAAYLAVALMFPRRPPLVVALVALFLCVTVEMFKLTGIPARAANVPVVPWLLGQTFSWHNLVCYCLGVVLVFILDTMALRTIRQV